jgi:cell division protein FtsQ
MANRTPGKWPYNAREPRRGKRVVKQQREEAPRGVLREEERAPRPWITPMQARFVVLAAVVSVFAAVGWWAYHSPYLTITDVTVGGATGIPADDVRQAAGIEGDSTFGLDLGAAEARIEAMPKVRNATVTKESWNSVRIVIEERVPWGSWQINGVNVPVDLDGYVLDGAPAPEGSPLIVEVEPKRALQPGDRLDAGAITLADRLLRESDEAFGRHVQALVYRQSAGLTVVLGAPDVDGKALWVTFGDSRDYEYKVAALFVLMQQAQEQDLALNIVDLRFGDRLSFN